jgi:Family of unknown function (DUF6282)
MSLRIDHAIDLHCHFGPDTIGGVLEAGDGYSVSAVEAAREAAETGHAALVLKSHSFASSMITRALEDAVPGISVFGGVCTDYISGGLNLSAIEAALALGAKIVWLPTVHSRQDFHKKRTATRPSYHTEGIAVTDDDGAVLPIVHEIFAMVREKDAILATGHTTTDEHYAVVKELAPLGKVLVTHAGEKLGGPQLDAAQCRELADLGAFIEVTAQLCKPHLGAAGQSPAEVIEMIRMIGSSRVCLSTDYGWTTSLPHPAAGMHEFLEVLWAEGMSEGDLRTMASSNPASLLGIDV